MPWRFGAFTFDAEAHELRRDGALVPLSPKAFRLLELLLDARPGAVPHESLYAALWPDVIVEPGNLHGLVSEVRTAIGHDAIRTVHRIGYAFTLPTLEASRTAFALLLGDDEIPLQHGENIIGRDPRAAVPINALEVSRHHAKLVVEATRITLEDLQSKNGTFVGRTRITTPVEVHPGDELLIGSIQLRLICVDPSKTTVTSPRA
ncbi:MAG TPA: FHA domain-containing protein [Thermoanaerobaculia bacterium]|nr:FHA domain-containing protein [Thermoanaerobaculia bacterium]